MWPALAFLSAPMYPGSNASLTPLAVGHLSRLKYVLGFVSFSQPLFGLLKKLHESNMDAIFLGPRRPVYAIRSNIASRQQLSTPSGCMIQLSCPHHPAKSIEAYLRKWCPCYNSCCAVCLRFTSSNWCQATRRDFLRIANDCYQNNRIALHSTSFFLTVMQSRFVGFLVISHPPSLHQRCASFQLLCVSTGWEWWGGGIFQDTTAH